MENLNNEEKETFNIILKKFNESYKQHTRMTKGKDSKVYLLNNKYIVKFNNRVTIEGEKVYFEKNHNKYNEKILLYDNENYNYIVYKFIENDDIAERKNINIKELIKSIKDLVYNYEKYDWNGYGYLFEEKKSWKQFFKTEMESRKENAFKYLEKSEYKKVEKAIELIYKYNFNTVILHGDLGIYNLLFKNNKLVGIIDPQPISGDCIYDYIFFIFSNLNFCKNIKLSDIYEDLKNEPIEKINAMIILILFDRIIRCVRYNIKNISEYLILWNKFSNILNY